MLNIVNAIVGGALLLAGRRLFWLFVGAAGFVTGIQLATRFFHGAEVTAIIVGLVVGLIFAALAIFLQTLAIGIAGFLAGGYILLALASMIGLDKSFAAWMIYIVGGVVGVILVSALFDWAIITLSSLAGASLIVPALNLQRVAGGVLFFVLFFAGVIIQGSILRNQERQARQNNN